MPSKKAVEEARDDLREGEAFYYTDEFNLSWMPTLRAVWSAEGQQVMIETPAQPTKRYGIGAVAYHTGETVVLIRRKRRREIAELLEALLEKHPTGIVCVAWDSSVTQEDEEVEVVLRAAVGRLVLLYLPTYSPWLNPIEMLWRHFRREVTHCELFPTIKALVTQPTISSSATTGDLTTSSRSSALMAQDRVTVFSVGCGVGDVSFLCTDLVGPKGEVVGVDRDPLAVSAA